MAKGLSKDQIVRNQLRDLAKDTVEYQARLHEQRNRLNMHVEIEVIPVGVDATNARPGDFILCHRKGMVSATIRLGEWLKFRRARWSHAAYIESPDSIIEALTTGVKRHPLSIYREIEYAIVRTHLTDEDAAQATAFARSCLGQHYGFLTDLGIALRFLTPGRGLWFGMNGTEICSGLVAQTQVRGWANFPNTEASLSPTELENYYARFAA